MQVEGEFIPYKKPIFDRGIDGFLKALDYKPYVSPFTRTVPGRHVRLAKVMYRIGYWFTEKAEDWDDRTFVVMPKRDSRIKQPKTPLNYSFTVKTAKED